MSERIGALGTHGVHPGPNMEFQRELIESGQLADNHPLMNNGPIEEPVGDGVAPELRQRWLTPRGNWQQPATGYGGVR